MKSFTVLIGLALALLTAGVLPAASGTSTTTDTTKLVIHHATLGCHTWTLGGEVATTHTLVLHQGQSFTVENRDNCGHELTQASGPEQASMVNQLTGASVTQATLMSFRPGVRVVPDKVGTYTFTTVERDDLAFGVDTDRWDGLARLSSTGTDNTLTLVVRVVPNRTHGLD